MALAPGGGGAKWKAKSKQHAKQPNAEPRAPDAPTRKKAKKGQRRRGKGRAKADARRAGACSKAGRGGPGAVLLGTAARCVKLRPRALELKAVRGAGQLESYLHRQVKGMHSQNVGSYVCKYVCWLLYTSDAADELMAFALGVTPHTN